MVLATLLDGTMGILFVAVPSAAIAIAVAPFLRRSRPFLFAPCVFAVLGSVLSLPAAVEVPMDAVGMPRDSVYRLRGQLIGDGRATKDGRGLYNVTVTGAVGETAEVHVDGPVLVVLTPDFVPLYAGDEVVVDGAPRSGTVMSVGAGDLRPAPSSFPSGGGVDRGSAMSALADAASSTDHTGILAALFLGRREFLSPVVNLAFRRAGASHILALSGMHLGIVSSIVVLAMGRIFGRRRATLFAVPLLAFYVYLVGIGPSLARALCFFVVSMAAMLSGRRVSGVQTLSISVIVLLVISPAWATELSFAYSFLALLGIFLVTPPVARFLRGRVPDVVSVPIAASVGAMLATAPLSLLSFGELFPVGVLSSIVLTPLVTILIVVGAPLMLVPGAGTVVTPFAEIIEGLVTALSTLPSLSPTGALLYLIAVCAVLPVLPPALRHLARALGAYELRLSR